MNGIAAASATTAIGAPSPEERARAAVRAAGLKVTIPRVRILALLCQYAVRSEHASAEQIHAGLRAQDAGIGLGTVYRVLAQLERGGLIESHQFAGNPAVYELAKTEHHDHMLDLDGGTVLEFSDPMIRERLRQLAAGRGYEIVAQELIVYVRGRATRTQKSHNGRVCSVAPGDGRPRRGARIAATR